MKKIGLLILLMWLVIGVACSDNDENKGVYTEEHNEVSKEENNKDTDTSQQPEIKQPIETKEEPNIDEEPEIIEKITESKGEQSSLLLTPVLKMVEEKIEGLPSPAYNFHYGVINDSDQEVTFHMPSGNINNIKLVSKEGNVIFDSKGEPSNRKTVITLQPGEYQEFGYGSWGMLEAGEYTITFELAEPLDDGETYKQTFTFTATR